MDLGKSLAIPRSPTVTSDSKRPLSLKRKDKARASRDQGPGSDESDVLTESLTYTRSRFPL